MKLFNSKDLDEYVNLNSNEEDPILLSMLAHEAKEDKDFTSHRWLLESSVQRMAYYHMYIDLLKTPKGFDTKKTVIDVGGGYCSLTRLLDLNHNYWLFDIMAHDIYPIPGYCRLVSEDWYEAPVTCKYDIIIANGLFPNTDQRLGLFIEKMLPNCKELRLLLTFYNNSRFYKTKRVDCEEILYNSAWNGDQLALMLNRYKYRIEGDPWNGVTDEQIYKVTHPTTGSLFDNGRYILMLKMRGFKS